MKQINFGEKIKIFCSDNKNRASSLGKFVIVWNYIDGSIKTQMIYKNFDAFFLGFWKNDPAWAVIWNPESCLVQLILAKDVDYIRV
jgi:hypothetical protein